MAERFDHVSVSGATVSFVPEIDRHQAGAIDTLDQGVVAEQSSGLTEYRYAEGIRIRRINCRYLRNSLADWQAFETFYEAVGSQRFRFTDIFGLRHLCSFVPGPVSRQPEEGQRFTWDFNLREENPPPGLARLPYALYPDLMFYLRAARGLTAYGRDAVPATFSRGSTATFIDPADGWLKTAAANVARCESAGLKLEGARTNLCLRSEEFDNASWTKSNVTVAANNTGTTDPRGGTSADLLTATAANGTVLQSFTIASASKVFTLYLKRKTGSGNVDISLDNGTGWTTVAINSTTWTRVAKVQTLANPTIGLRIVTSGDEVWAWGAQLEDGATFASSYIPTTSAAVTRSADILTFPASGNLTAATGAALVVFTPAGIDNAVGQTIVSLDDGTANERIALLTSTASALRPRARVDDGGVSQADLTVGAGTDDFVLNTKKSLGVTWAVNDVRLFSSGVERATDASATMPAPTTIRLGSAVAGAEPAFGWLRDVCIFGRNLSAAEMLAVHNGIIV